VKKNKKALKVGTAEPFKMDFHWAPEPAWHPGEFDYYARGVLKALIAKYPIPMFEGDATKLQNMIIKGATRYAMMMMAEKREAFLPAPKLQDGMALAM
jgi:hypothetical protein